MISQRSTLRAISHLIFSCGLVKLASLCKVSYIVGSFSLFFSASSFAMPLVGLYGGNALSALVCFVKIVPSMLMGFSSLSMLAYHIPGLCAALYWQSGTMIRLVLPATCFFLFTAHPEGVLAYALYWLIPCTLYFVPKKSLFFDALSATFIAHAVGSVIFIYTLNVPAATWLALIPVVAVERLLFALGMVLVYHAVAYLQRSVTRGYTFVMRTCAAHSNQ